MFIRNDLVGCCKVGHFPRFSKLIAARESKTACRSTHSLVVIQLQVAGMISNSKLGGGWVPRYTPSCIYVRSTPPPISLISLLPKQYSHVSFFIQAYPFEVHIGMMHNTRPSSMVRKSLQDNASSNPSRLSLLPPSDNSDESSLPQDSNRDKYCFFYETLMDPGTKSKVLGSSRRPHILLPARITGYQIKLWGPHPALLDDKPLHPVDGMVCGLLSPIELDRIAAYETDNYHLQDCLIEVLDDDANTKKTIEGVTFMWSGRHDELWDGTFDLKQ